MTYTGEVGILGRWWWSTGQDAALHLLLQPGGGDLEQHVEVLSLILVVLGRYGLKRPTEVADETHGWIHQVLFDTRRMVDPVAVPTEEYLPSS